MSLSLITRNTASQIRRLILNFRIKFRLIFYKKQIISNFILKKYFNCVKFETSIELKVIILIFQINDKKRSFKKVTFDFFFKKHNYLFMILSFMGI